MLGMLVMWSIWEGGVTLGLGSADQVPYDLKKRQILLGRVRAIYFMCAGVVHIKASFNEEGISTHMWYSCVYINHTVLYLFFYYVSLKILALDIVFLLRIQGDMNKGWG